MQSRNQFKTIDQHQPISPGLTNPENELHGVKSPKDNYNIINELNKYNQMSPFDNVYNKRHDFQIPIAMKGAYGTRQIEEANPPLVRENLKKDIVSIIVGPPER